MKKKLFGLVLCLMICMGVVMAQAQRKKLLAIGLLHVYENEAYTTSADFSVIKRVFSYSVYDSLHDSILGLLAGKTDYINIPDFLAEYLVDAQPQLEMGQKEGIGSFCMATSPAKKALRDKLDRGIRILKENGKLAALLNQYLPAKNLPEADALPAKAGRQTIRIAMTGDFPPLDYLNASGKPAGFNRALLSALSEVLEVNFIVVPVAAGDRLDSLVSNKVDALFYAFGYGSEKNMDSRVLLTSEYYQCGGRILVSKGRLDEINKRRAEVAKLYTAKTGRPIYL